jgi:hypothetical protein
MRESSAERHATPERGRGGGEAVGLETSPQYPWLSSRLERSRIIQREIRVRGVIE